VAEFLYKAKGLACLHPISVFSAS